MRVQVLGALLAVAFASGCAEDGGNPVEPQSVIVPLFVQSGTPKNFRTHATGAEEVPARDTKAQGQAIFKVNGDGTISYKLIVANIVNVLQAHIHVAPAGTNGGIVVFLYPPGPPAVLIPGRSQGILGEGVITDAQLMGSLAGQTVADLLEEILAGNTYVNVHTSQFPGGEIRGQID